mgnify:CR=1 FL=1
MKPIVIIAIAVVCSVGAVLGILFVDDLNNQIEYQKTINQYQRNLENQQIVYEHELKLQEQYEVQDSKNKDNLTQQKRNECAEKYLGHKHVWQQKHGFSGPVPYWVNKNTQYFSDSIRYINNIPGLENLDIGKYLILLEKNELNTIDSFAIFTLYCLQKWYDSQVTDI